MSVERNKLISNDRKLWAWQFTSIATHGAGARVAALEGAQELEIIGNKPVSEHVELEDVDNKVSAIFSRKSEARTDCRLARR